MTPPRDVVDAAFESFRNDLVTLLGLQSVVENALADNRQFEKQWLRKRPAFFPTALSWSDHRRDVAEKLEASPRVLRSSLLVMLFAEFEYFLHEQCLVLKDVCGLSLAPGDIAGKGIERSRTYLKKVAGVAFPDTDSSWQRIILLRELRHCVAHAGARPSAKLARDLADGRFVSMTSPSRIAPTKTAFMRFFKAVLVFTRRFHYAVNRRTKGRIR